MQQRLSNVTGIKMYTLNQRINADGENASSLTGKVEWPAGYAKRTRNMIYCRFLYTLAIINLLAASCSFVSNQPTHADVTVDGVLYQHDKPLPDVFLKFNSFKDFDCSDEWSQIVTDKNGHFSESITIERGLISVAGLWIDETIYPFNLCAKIDGEWKKIWFEFGDNADKHIICVIEDKSGECWYADEYLYLHEKGQSN
jgi:hypothetical protein